MSEPAGGAHMGFASYLVSLIAFLSGSMTRIFSRLGKNWGRLSVVNSSDTEVVNLLPRMFGSL